MPSITKTKRILNYLKANPDHTWSDAEPKLSKHEITGNYFSMVKSKNFTNADDSSATRSPKSRTKQKGKKQSATDASELQLAAAFAKKVGGIASAKAALSQLEQMQI